MRFFARYLVVGMLTMAVWLLSEQVQAQPYAPVRPMPAGFRSPVVSPYINLLQRGSSPAVNYYGLVRPDLDVRNALQNLQTQTTALSAEDQLLSELPNTGHPSTFMNYSHYFGSSLTAARPGLTGAAPPTAPQQGGQGTAMSGQRAVVAPRAPTR